MQQRHEAKDGQPGMPMKDHQRLHNKSRGSKNDDEGKGKTVLKEKTPKKDRKGDTPTAKQITSSAQKEKLPPPQLRDEGRNGQRSNGRRTYRREALSQSIGRKSNLQLWAGMANTSAPSTTRLYRLQCRLMDERAHCSPRLTIRLTTCTVLYV
jgi:hypothetical protein